MDRRSWQRGDRDRVTLTTRRMSDLHETYLADLLGGRRTRGSGNQSRDQMDGKNAYHSGAFVFAWDGKSTLGRSLSVSLDMWRKAREQSHWATPLLGLRWYRNERLTEVALDLVVVEASVFADLLRAANERMSGDDGEEDG